MDNSRQYKPHGVYLCQFVQRHMEFRVPEFKALAELVNLEYTLVEPAGPRTWNYLSPFWYIVTQKDQEDKLKEIAGRSVLVKNITHLWGDAPTFPEALTHVRLLRQETRRHSQDSGNVFKVKADGVNAKMSLKQQGPYIEALLQEIDVKGRVDLAKAHMQYNIIMVDYTPIASMVEKTAEEQPTRGRGARKDVLTRDMVSPSAVDPTNHGMQAHHTADGPATPPHQDGVENAHPDTRTRHVEDGSSQRTDDPAIPGTDCEAERGGVEAERHVEPRAKAPKLQEEQTPGEAAAALDQVLAQQVGDQNHGQPDAGSAPSTSATGAAGPPHGTTLPHSDLSSSPFDNIIASLPPAASEQFPSDPPKAPLGQHPLAASVAEGGEQSDTPERDPQYVRFFIGRHVAESDRTVLSQYALSGRACLGPTSMDPELTFIMANLILVRRGHLVLDPFVGTGSCLVPAAHLGATTMGADIDWRVVVRGTGDWGKEKNLYENFAQYGLAPPVGVFLGDITRSPVREVPEGWVDGITCDPPYGLRAGGKKTAEQGREVLDADKYIVPKEACRLGVLLWRLLDFAARHLRVGGRMVYWVPVVPALYDDAQVVRHPMLQILADCEQALQGRYSRRLYTVKKVREYDAGAVQEFLNSFGIPDLVVDNLHSIVFSKDPPPKKYHKFRGKRF